MRDVEEVAGTAVDVDDVELVEGPIDEDVADETVEAAPAGAGIGM